MAIATNERSAPYLPYLLLRTAGLQSIYWIGIGLLPSNLGPPQTARITAKSAFCDGAPHTEQRSSYRGVRRIA